MYLIVGLGNPGQKYEHTRHNVGFDVLDTLARRQGVTITREKDQALIGETFIGLERVLLCKPQTFMNLSGLAVGELVRYFHIPLENVLVIYDDTDLPQGHIRIRKNGSAGTHNGMRSIVQELGSEAFPRLRIGIGERREGYELADWVLGHYITQEEKDNAQAAFATAAEAVEEYITKGIESAMCRFNTKKQKKEPKKEPDEQQAGSL